MLWITYLGLHLRWPPVYTQTEEMVLIGQYYIQPVW